MRAGRKADHNVAVYTTLTVQSMHATHNRLAHYVSTEFRQDGRGVTAKIQFTLHTVYQKNFEEGREN